MIAPTPFFADRGCHTQIYEEIKGLEKLGHSILLCTYGLGRDISNIKIIRCFNFPWYKKLSAGPSFSKLLLLPILTMTTLRMIWKFEPDIIHAHLHEGACIAKICQLFYWRKKYLFDMQGSLSGELLQHGLFKNRTILQYALIYIEKLINSWFPIITQSETMIKELKKINYKKKDITNVKDGVDTDIFSPINFNLKLAKELNINYNKQRVLFMGLLEEYQGVDIMLQAFSKVIEIFPKIQFIIIGYPNIEKYLKICKKLKMENNVYFLGRIDYQSLPKYLSLSQIAVAPKIAETEGDGKIYNYMAMGMATIAFDREVSKEILGDTGFFAKMGDYNSLSEKIIYAINHPQECMQKGKSARERAIKKLSWDAVAKRIDKVYKKL